MKIFVTSNVPQAIEKVILENYEVNYHNSNIPLTKEEIIAGIGDAEAMVTPLSDKIDKDVIDAGKNLKLIANYGAGFDNIDINYAREKGIIVTNAPAPSSAVSTVELTFALMLSLARKMFPAAKDLKEGKFQAWRPTYFLGEELRGKTLGILGMGNIGKELAKRALAFGMTVVYDSRTPKADIEALGAIHKDKETVIKEADFLSLHTAYTPDLHHMIAEDELAMMKKSAYLINAARGPLLKEEALIQALKEEKIAGAALDVFEFEPRVSEELFAFDNVVLLPHLGNATIEARLEMGEAVLNNLAKYSAGEKPSYQVN